MHALAKSAQQRSFHFVNLCTVHFSTVVWLEERDWTRTLISLASIQLQCIRIINMEHQLYSLSTKTVRASLPQPWIRFCQDFYQLFNVYIPSYVKTRISFPPAPTYRTTPPYLYQDLDNFPSPYLQDNSPKLQVVILTRSLTSPLQVFRG